MTSGLAGIKLSGSPNKYGLRSVNMINLMSRIINPAMSLKVKYGWNGILSIFLLIPRGLLAPTW